MILLVHWNLSFLKSTTKKTRPNAALVEDYHHSADDPNLTIYMINVEIVKAQNLPNRNGGLKRQLVQKGDLTDPYCIVAIGGMFCRTHTIQDDLNPVWNEQMIFLVRKKAT